MFGKVHNGLNVLDQFAALDVVDLRESVTGNLSIIQNIIILDSTITPDSAADSLRINTSAAPTTRNPKLMTAGIAGNDAVPTSYFRLNRYSPPPSNGAIYHQELKGQATARPRISSFRK